DGERYAVEREAGPFRLDRPEPEAAVGREFDPVEAALAVKLFQDESHPVAPVGVGRLVQVRDAEVGGRIELVECVKAGTRRGGYHTGAIDITVCAIQQVRFDPGFAVDV